MTPAEYAFEKRLAEMRESMERELARLIAPLVAQGEQALREYVEGEGRLKDERFSRS